MPDPLEPGDPERLGDYWLAGRLGAGGQGVVFDAYSEDGTRVAVKVFHAPDGMTTRDLERMAREVKTAQRVASFCTAKVLDVEMEGPRPYIVSEFVEGRSLGRTVHEGRRFTGDELHRLAIGIATALTAIHEAGVIHRDLKPDNVLLGPDGPRVIDFGIARTLEMSLTPLGNVAGTPMYMAPEIFEGQRATAASDVFAWGAIMYFAATGEEPFRGDSLPEVMHRVLNFQPDFTTLPESIRSLVQAAMSKDPLERPPARSLLSALTVGATDPSIDMGGLMAQGSAEAGMLSRWEPTDPALGQIAEEAYESLEPEDREYVPELFLRLVTAGDDGTLTSRRLPLAEYLDRPQLAETQAMQRVLAAFRRLVVQSGDQIVLTRPALLRAWPRLRTWLEQEREGLPGHQEIRHAATAWAEHGRRRGDVLTGARLQEALLWTAHHQRPSLNRIERAFLDAGTQAQTRAARQRQILTATLAVLLVLALASTGVAINAQRTARAAQRETAEQRDVAVARLVAGEASTLQQSQPGLAKQLSVVAYKADPGSGLASLFGGLDSPGTFAADQPARDISVSRDGTRLAISSGAGVALWDIGKGNGLGRIPLTKSESVALSPNARLVAAAVPDAKPGEPPIRVWNVSDPARPSEITGLPQTPPAASMTFSQDGRTLALGLVTGGIRLWDMTNPSSPHQLRSFTGHAGEVDSVAFAPSGRLLATAGADGTVMVWNPGDAAGAAGSAGASGTKPLAELPGLRLEWSKSRKSFHRLAFSPDGRILAGPGDGTSGGKKPGLKSSHVSLWNVQDPAKPRHLSTSREDSDYTCLGDLFSTSFSPDGRHLATTCYGNVTLWSMDPQSKLFSVNNLTGAGSEFGEGPVLFVPHGFGLLQGTTKGVLVWNAELPARLGATATLGGKPSGFQVTAAYSTGPRRLHIVQGADFGTLRDLSKDGIKRLADLSGSGQTGAQGAAFSPGGDVLALSEMAAGKPVVRLRATTAGAPVLGTINEIANGVEDVSFSRDGKVLAVADNNDYNPAVSSEPAVKLFDISAPARPRLINSMKGDVYFVAFAPKGDMLVATAASTLYAWDVSNMAAPAAEPPRQLTPGAGVSQPAFRPDGKLLAVGDSRDTMRLWRVDDDRLIGEPVIVRTPGSGNGLSFSPDGRMLAWAAREVFGDSGTSIASHVELWDVSNPQSPAHRVSFSYEKNKSVDGVWFSHDTKAPQLTVVSDTIAIWRTDADWAIKTLCASVGDEITRAQWRTYVPGLPYDPPCD